MRTIIYDVVIAGLAGPVFTQGAATAGTKQETFDEAAWSAEFHFADKDGDGKLSREEALAANPNLGDHFKVIDADGDGFITAEKDRRMERATGGTTDPGS